MGHVGRADRVFDRDRWYSSMTESFADTISDVLAERNRRRQPEGRAEHEQQVVEVTARTTRHEHRDSRHHAVEHNAPPSCIRHEALTGEPARDRPRQRARLHTVMIGDERT